jgi:hypothetical protein
MSTRSIGAAHHRIAHRRRIEALVATDEIVPRYRSPGIEPEAPVRRSSRRLEPGPLGVAQAQRGAVVHRRQSPPEQHLALEIELLRGLVGGIDPARRLQFGEPRLVAVEPCRLALLGIGHQPQPGEIGADRIDVPFFAARAIGIIDPQQEAPAIGPREQPVVQRGPEVADVQIAGRARRETGNHGHTGHLSTNAALRHPHRTVRELQHGACRDAHA